MKDAESLFVAVGVAVVLLAAVSAWIDSRSKPVDGGVYRQVLWRTRAYRERLARWKGR